MVYLKSVENVITLGKLIGLLFLFCLPLLSILFLKTKRNDLDRPVMETIFLVNISREISIEHPSVGLASLSQSREISIEHASVGLALRSPNNMANFYTCAQASRVM